MIQGSLSDRLGRRLPLLIGTLVYAGASFGCALAPGLISFSGFRMLAAVSGSASMVIPRALIRDVTGGIAAARQLSRLTLVMGVVPILAPALGGVLLTFMNWRDLFWAAGIYGAVCAALVWRFLPDTLPEALRLRHSLAQMLERYVQIAREPVFVTNALMSGLGFAALFAYISASALVYISYFHVTPAQYGVVFGGNAFGFIGASQLSARLAGRFGIDRVLHVGARVLFAAFATAAVVAFAHVGGLLGLAVPIFVGQAAIGLMSPLATVNALAHHRAHAGSASALMGTWQFSLGAVAGVLVGLTSNGTPIPMGVLMVLFASLVVVMDWLRPPGGFPA
jgi:DHA1 family bicyclomycin/chloramphenicol resistance-like MFS transporter